MFRNHLAFILLASLPVVSSCTDSSAIEDELAGDASDELAGKTDVAGDTFTYFSIRRDVRKCASPMCGGYFVARVNSAATTCADGKRQAECYVATLDTRGSDLSDRDLEPFFLRVHADGGALVRGAIKAQRYPGFGNLGRLDATEAWVAGAAAGAPAGVAVKVEQTGIRCIQAPCEDKLESKLNSSSSARIADLDATPSGASDDEVARMFDALTSEGGTRLIVFGDRYRVRANGISAKGRTVEQFYTRLPEPAPALLTVEACEALGGHVRGDIGDGQIQCAADEHELGRVAIGIEGGVCCAAN